MHLRQLPTPPVADALPVHMLCNSSTPPHPGPATDEGRAAAALVQLSHCCTPRPPSKVDAQTAAQQMPVGLPLTNQKIAPAWCRTRTTHTHTHAHTHTHTHTHRHTHSHTWQHNSALTTLDVILRVSSSAAITTLQSASPHQGSRHMRHGSVLVSGHVRPGSVGTIVCARLLCLCAQWKVSSPRMPVAPMTAAVAREKKSVV
jgi:hypothetical protein